MPKLIDSLTIENKHIAEEIIDQLIALKPQADGYSEQLNQFKQSLEMVASTEEFHDIVHHIIEEKQLIRAPFAKVMAGLDKDIVLAVQEYINEDPNLNSIKQAMQVKQILRDDIINAKERISKATLFNPLPDEQRVIVEKFVASVKELQGLADKLKLRKDQLIEQLSEVRTDYELDELEEEIITQDLSLASHYNASVSYPENEETAGALIKFLEINPHILGIMKAFNLYEPLVDDILRARMNINNHSSMGP